MNNSSNPKIYLKTKNYNKMGRKKLINERFQIRCHPKVIKEVREYAKQRTKEELLKEKKL